MVGDSLCLVGLYIFDIFNQPDGTPVVASGIFTQIQTAIIEKYLVGIINSIRRTRPVLAAGIDITDIATACCRQEYCAMGLEIAGPLSGSNGIACKIGNQSVIPIIGQQNYTIFAIYSRLRVADARGGGAVVEQVNPLILGQRTPTKVRCIATISDGKRAPVALQGRDGVAIAIIIIIS